MLVYQRVRGCHQEYLENASDVADVWCAGHRTLGCAAGVEELNITRIGDVLVNLPKGDRGNERNHVKRTCGV